MQFVLISASGFGVEDVGLSVDKHQPASSISLVNALVQTDPLPQLASEIVQLLPVSANQADIQWVESPSCTKSLVSGLLGNLLYSLACYLHLNIKSIYFTFELEILIKKSLILYCFVHKVQPSSEHAPSPEEAPLPVQSKGPSASVEGRNADTSGNDYLSTSNSQLTTTSTPVVLNSGATIAGSNFDVYSTHHAPATVNGGEENLLHLTATTKTTNETVTASPPKTAIGISHDTSVKSLVSTDLEPLYIEDITGQENAVPASLVQEENNQDQRVHYQVSCCL